MKKNKHINCTCLSDTADKLKLRVLEPDADPPKDATVRRIMASNYSFMLRAGQWRLFIPFTVQWDGVKKGTAGVRDGQTKVNVLAKYCPLCGKEFKDE